MATLLTSTGLRGKLSKVLEQAEITEDLQSELDSVATAYDNALTDLSAYGDVVNEEDRTEFEYVGRPMPEDLSETLRKKEEELANLKAQYISRFNNSGEEIIEETPPEPETTTTAVEDILDDLVDLYS